jgi:hypothetical protein
MAASVLADPEFEKRLVGSLQWSFDFPWRGLPQELQYAGIQDVRIHALEPLDVSRLPDGQLLLRLHLRGDIVFDYSLSRSEYDALSPTERSRVQVKDSGVRDPVEVMTLGLAGEMDILATITPEDGEITALNIGAIRLLGSEAD